jgi:hypothetical protein
MAISHLEKVRLPSHRCCTFRGVYFKVQINSGEGLGFYSRLRVNLSYLLCLSQYRFRRIS